MNIQEQFQQRPSSISAISSQPNNILNAKMVNKDYPQKTKEDVSRSTIDIFGFLGFAAVFYVLYSSILASAQDILASSNIPTTSIILCFNGPYFIMTFILPYFIDRLSLMAKAVGTSLFFGTGILIITLAPTPSYRLIGVALASVGTGTAEIGFLAATSLHEDMTIHSFTAGTAFGSLIGTVYMSVATTVLCINPKAALQILLILLPIFPILAWLIEREKKNRTEKIKSSLGSRVEYTLLSGDDQNPSATLETVNHEPLTMKEKFSAAYGNLYLAVPLFLGLFADYLSTQGIVTTIAFENSPFDARDHFLYYTLTFWCSQIIGRTYGLVILWFKPTTTVVTEKTWVFTAFIICSMILLVLDSWYRFFPNFGCVAIVISVIAITEGALYLNTFAVAGKTADKSPRRMEFSRAFLTFALQSGIVVAGLLGLYVEPKLREHCEVMMLNKDMCFTRLIKGQWNATSSCVTH